MQIHASRLLPLVAAALLVGCSGAGTGASSAPAASDPAVAATLRPVAFGQAAGDARCDLGGHDDAYHLHVRFRTVVNGTPSDPDSNIGVDETTCMYWVHTHDATGGVVHIEAPADVTITLGDFMDVWGATFPDSMRLRAALNGLQAGRLTVDGAPAPADWRDIQLKDGLDLLVED